MNNIKVKASFNFDVRKLAVFRVHVIGNKLQFLCWLKNVLICNDSGIGNRGIDNRG